MDSFSTGAPMPSILFHCVVHENDYSRIIKTNSMKERLTSLRKKKERTKQREIETERKRESEKKMRRTNDRANGRK